MKRILAPLVGLTVLVSGCGPTLSHVKDYSIALGEVIAVPIDPISREQTIRVSATSADKPISVHVYLAADEEAVERDIMANKLHRSVLASQTETQEVSLEAVVPANKEVIVRLQPSGPTSAEVHLEITN